MNVQDVLDQYRSDMMDQKKPFFWTDFEVLGYMNDAYRMFVRLTGGVTDFTSDIMQARIFAGVNIGLVDKRVLRIMQAFRVSDGREIKIINQTDLTFARDNDYGTIRPLYLDTTPGPVRYMIIGAERGKCQWVQMPEVDDVVQLHGSRLPATIIDRDGSNLDFEFDEIGDEHVEHLVKWMRHRGYLKNDADTFDRGASDDYKVEFEDYCKFAKSEMERAKAKPRVVVYGGL